MKEESSGRKIAVLHPNIAFPYRKCPGFIIQPGVNDWVVMEKLTFYTLLNGARKTVPDGRQIWFDQATNSPRMFNEPNQRLKK